MTEPIVDENIIGNDLTLKQEQFCRNYTQNDAFYGNGTLSYADAYGFDLDSQPKDDAIYEQIEGKDGLEQGELLEKSSYQRMYDLCSSYASRLTRNHKIQKRCRDLLNEMMTDHTIDARLTEIIIRGEDKDSIQAIKEFNKLKQRIVERKDITSGGKAIGAIIGMEIIKDNGHQDTVQNPERETTPSE